MGAPPSLQSRGGTHTLQQGPGSPFPPGLHLARCSAAVGRGGPTGSATVAVVAPGTCSPTHPASGAFRSRCCSGRCWGDRGGCLLWGEALGEPARWSCTMGRRGHEQAGEDGNMASARPCAWHERDEPTPGTVLATDAGDVRGCGRVLLGQGVGGTAGWQRWLYWEVMLENYWAMASMGEEAPQGHWAEPRFASVTGTEPTEEERGKAAAARAAPALTHGSATDRPRRGQEGSRGGPGGWKCHFILPALL